MKKLLWLTILVSVVTLVGFWGGRRMCMLMWPGSIQPNKAWYFNLGLTPKQAESLKELDAGFRRDAEKACMGICAERLKLFRLLRDPKTKPDEIDKKIEEIGAMQVVLEKQIAGHILNVKKDLTPPQSEAYLSRIYKEFLQSVKQSGYDEILQQV